MQAQSAALEAISSTESSHSQDIASAAPTAGLSQMPVAAVLDEAGPASSQATSAAAANFGLMTTAAPPAPHPAGATQSASKWKNRLHWLKSTYTGNIFALVALVYLPIQVYFSFRQDSFASKQSRLALWSARNDAFGSCMDLAVALR